MKIYLAGKISKNDWRHKVVEHLRGTFIGGCPSSGEMSISRGIAKDEEYPSWPILKNAVFGVFDYSGPYFVCDDHGCWHGDNSHGFCAAEEVMEDWCAYENDEFVVTKRIEHPKMQSHIVHQCQIAINRSDLFFAWIDRTDAYGTLVELGYAFGRGIRIVCAMPKHIHDSVADLWFPRELCRRYGRVVIADSPESALSSVLFANTCPEGCVYFIESVGSGHIKIGWTGGEPEQRLKQLQTGSACVLKLLGSIPGSQSLESKLHEEFASLRHNGEWFHGTGELRKYIASVAKKVTA